MPNTFSGLAREIFTTEFFSETGVASFSHISGWLAANVGNLNVRLNTNFTGVDPEIDKEAGAIFKSMYMSSYYGRMAMNAARGVISSSNGENILSVSDGDNKITFANRNEVAKSFRGIKKDLDEAIDKSVHQYNMYFSQPTAINGIEIYCSGYYD